MPRHPKGAHIAAIYSEALEESSGEVLATEKMLHEAHELIVANEETTIKTIRSLIAASDVPADLWRKAVEGG